MKKQLFFDDSRLFGRDHVKRVYGTPDLIAKYQDGICSTDFCTGQVFRLDNGKYRMLYFGHSTAFRGKRLFSAISEDGVHFKPEMLDAVQESSYPHEVMALPKDAEVAFIYEDKTDPHERYKMLMSEPEWRTLSIYDTLYTSADLLHWTKKEGAFWGDGTEPLASVFYNEKKRLHTVVERPFWGVRTVGQKETADFQNFSEFRHTLGVDSEEEPLAEIYGMFAFGYDGTYIGLPHLYRGLHSEYSAKYKNGIIDTQLAYSEDGEYWHRSLKEPFISGGEQYPITWIAGMTQAENGDVYLYGSASEQVHGPAFHEPGTGTILIYRLRQDGFIALESIDDSSPARIITREKVWHGGELQINLTAKHATVAVYISDESEMVSGNVLGIAKPIPGYTHEDCIPFSGDSVSFSPRYTSGKTLDSLKGKTLVFEIRFTDGKLYSLSGDYTDVFNTEGARYRKFSILPSKS